MHDWKTGNCNKPDKAKRRWKACERAGDRMLLKRERELRRNPCYHASFRHFPDVTSHERRMNKKRRDRDRARARVAKHDEAPFCRTPAVEHVRARRPKHPTPMPPIRCRGGPPPAKPFRYGTWELSLYDIACTYEMKNDVRRAITWHRMSHDPRSHKRLFHIHMRDGRFEDAVREFELAVAIDPSFRKRNQQRLFTCMMHVFDVWKLRANKVLGYLADQCDDVAVLLRRYRVPPASIIDTHLDVLPGVGVEYKRASERWLT